MIEAESLLMTALLTLLAVVTVGVILMRNLFGVVVLFSIYSFLMASVLVVLDGVDVAMTEAAVGAGLSTVVLLATLHLTKTTEYPRSRPAYIPLFVTGVVAVGLILGTWSLPEFGTADAPIHQHVAPKYLADSYKETHVPNVVTSVLADYRSYDTLGETLVVFTAGIGVLVLLLGRRRKKSDGEAGS